MKIFRKISQLYRWKYIFLLGILLPVGLNAQTADFTANNTEICPGTFAVFSEMSTFPGGPAITYEWNFPGGFADSTTIPNPTVFYPTPGTYSVSLIVCEAGFGCDTMVKTAYIDVSSAPVAEFTWTIPDLCNGVELSFTNTSFTSGGGYGYVLWDFRDGASASTVDATHEYATPGNYDVILIISDSAGCFDDTVITVITDTLLSASLNIDTSLGCIDPISPTISANVFGGTGPYNYSWDFGNGSSSSSPIVTTTYSACTVYDIQLDITDQNGCPASFNFPGAAEIFCPTLGFTLSADTLCAGETLTVTDASSPSTSSSWQFDISDPTTTDDSLTADYTYNTAGTYTIEHCVSFANGCVECMTQDIVVVSTDLIGDFEAVDSAGCLLPFSTLLTATGGAPGLNYSWQVGSFTYTGNPVTATVTSYGGYNVTLTATNSLGCVDVMTKPAFLDVKALVPQFNSPNLSGCIPLSPTFNNSSYSLSDPIDSFHWDMGDGFSFYTTSAAPFSHTYTAIGTYVVTLTVYAGSCSNSTTRTVRTADVVADFMLTDTTCGYVNLINLTNQSTNTVIDWGDGDVSIPGDPMSGGIHFYITDDTVLYPITLTATQNGCTDTHTDYVLIHPTQIYDFDIRYDCANPYTGTIEIIDTWVLSPGFCWDIGNGDTLCGQNPVTITFPTTGSHPVFISDSGNIYFDSLCYQDYFQINIAIDTADFVANPPSLCEPGTVDLINVNNNPLFDTLNYSWTVGPSLLNGITGSATAYSDTFTYSFSTPDVYPIYGTVLDSGVCNMFVYDTIIVGEAHAFFQVDSMVGCDTIAVYFGDSSYTVDPTQSHIYIQDWEWKFGFADCPDYNGVDPPPCHYPLGSYVVELIATDNAGCVDSFSQVITVGSGTIPDFGFDSTFCGNDTVTFTSLTTGPASTFVWDLGDGSTAYGPVADHVYASSGTYTVTLTVYDSEGCTYPISQTIDYERKEIVAQMSIEYLSPSACPPIPILLTDTSIGVYDSLKWLVQTPTGSIDTLLGDSAVYTYLAAGDINIRQVITDARGCTDTAHFIDQINIGGLTGDMYLPSPEGCAPLDVFFDLENLNAVQVYIDFGDGDTVQVYGDVWHTYTDTGVYCPRLILIDTAGCQAVYSCPTSVQVTSGPLASFRLSDTSFCIGQEIWLEDQTAILSGVPFTSYYVNYGDGSDTLLTGSFDSIPYNYSSPGSYTLEVIVADATGCADTVSQTVDALRTPTAALAMPTDGCAPYDALLTLSAINADSVFIDYGDGDTSLVTGSVAHTYLSPGAYFPSLLLKDVTGCLGQTPGDTLYVAHPPQADMVLLPDSAFCAGEPHMLYNLTIDSVADSRINAVDSLIIEIHGAFYAGYAWFDSLDISTMGPGTHTISLIALNENGCYDTAFATVNVLAAPLANGGPDFSICIGGDVTLDASASSPGLSYDWYPPANVADPSAQVTTYTAAHSDTLVLTVFNSLCSATDTVIIDIIDTLGIAIDPYVEVCYGNGAELNGIAPVQPNGFSFNWSPIDNMLNETTLTPSVFPDSTQLYTLFASCGDIMEEAYVMVDVLDPPSLEVYKEDEIAFYGVPTGLGCTISGANGTVTYNWYSAIADFSCTNCPNPLIQATGDGWVYLEITDEIGCVVLDSIYMRVLTDCLDGEFNIGQAITPNGDGLNDELTFFSETMQSLNYFKVYNRWGMLLWETMNEGDGWDGTYHGQPVQPGVYVYMIEGICFSGLTFTRSGDVTVIR